MKKFDEFINESDSDLNEINALDTYSLKIKDEWKDIFEKNDILRNSVNNIIGPTSGNVEEVFYNKDKRAISFTIYCTPPSSIDGLIEFLKELKLNITLTNWFEIKYNTDSLIIKPKVMYKHLDQNVLKSYMNINKYDL